MKTFNLLLPVLLATWAKASPAGTAQTTKCNVGDLKKDPQAKPFCSSYQSHITTVSSGTRTVTTKTTVPARTTTTVTATETTTVTTTSTESSSVTTTVTSVASCASSATSVPSPIATQSSVPFSSSFFHKRDAPSPTPSALSGRPSASISSSCSCLGITATTKTSTVPATTTTSTSTITKGKPTTFTTSVTTTSTETDTATVTTTTTSTVTVFTPSTTLGYLNYHVYQDPYDFYGSPDVDPTIFNSPNFNLSGKVSNVVNVAPGYQVPRCYLPGGQLYTSCDYMAVVMQGYFLPPQDGQYSFTTSGNAQANVDNYLGFWTGDSAYQNYNKNNADFIAIRVSGNFQGGTSSLNAQKGQLVPVTLIYINGGGAGSFKFDIITPDGIVHSDSSKFWFPACPSSGQYNNPFSP